jgi:hypothetical protein
MRKDEPKQIAEIFRDKCGINLVSVDAEARFLQKNWVKFRFWRREQFTPTSWNRAVCTAKQ